VFADDVKVLTWNTFLIPPPLNFTKQAKRANQMMEIMPAFEHDVMFFQEAFYDKYRNRLIEKFKSTHPYSAVPEKGHKFKHFQDSGLFIVSRLPMRILDQVIFEACTHSDCFSSKSAILVEVETKTGLKIQFANTHLQAWEDSKSVEVRNQQLAQIKAMMNKHLQPGIPQVLVGDLNIDGKLNDEYPAALNLMEMISTPLEGQIRGTNGFPTKGCFKKPGEDNEEWLDHVWVKPNSTPITVSGKTVRPITGNLKDVECPLSDHYAVEANINL
jgi:endonuclease/exonuclease/phosphatase family metal-dependent hydrolase